MKIKIPKKEIVTVYSYFESNPYSRWHGSQNPYEQTSIEEWDSLSRNEINKIVIKFIFSVFCWALGVYLMIHLLVGYSNTYLWMTLLSFSTAFLFTFTELGVAFYIGMPKYTSISGFYSVLLSACIFSFNQFAYDILQNEFFSRRYQRLHYLFQGVVGVFALVNAISLIYYPSSYELDLTKHAIKNSALGPSLLPPILLVMIWILYLAPLIYFSFFSTIKKRKHALYLFITIIFLSLLPIKYFAIKYLPSGEMMQVFMSNEAIIGIMFLMMAATASGKIKTTEKGFLESQMLLKEAYSRFVPNELTDHLNKKSILNIKLGDHEELELSILFSDIRNFTSISERLTPEENFKFINEYLSIMVPIVKENNGFVNKFIGDSIMALYPSRADEAVNSAIEMCQSLRKYNEEKLGSSHNDPIRIGVGINTGNSVLGTLGDNKRMETSVISSAVNIASRLEALTKEYGVPVLLSGQTFKNLSKNRFRLRWIDRTAVKGQKQETDIYELIDAHCDEEILLKQRTLPLFERAMTAFYRDEKERAYMLFEGVLQENPNDSVAIIYMQRCSERRGDERRSSPRMNLAEKYLVK